MRISIFGLGYVGVVSAACLAREGHTVMGVDPNRQKVELISKGQSPIIEQDLDQLLAENVRAGLITATTDAKAAVEGTEISLICVGTPSQLNGKPDLQYICRVCEEIGAAIGQKDEYHVVVARSTMLPGSVCDTVIPVLEAAAGKKSGVDFGVCNNPEFLREGTAIYDYQNPPKTVIGETDKRSGNILASLYENLDAPLIRTDIAVAEMAKYTDNVWHALKVCFANEIGNVCKEIGIDGHQVMDIFCQDTKLNLSPYYLKPGFAFGGSCLPKDVRAINYKAKSLDLELPVIASIMANNQCQIDRGFEMITRKGNKKVSILGFSFKAGTDDLRESPIVEVIERLIGKGYDLKLYDKNVNMARLFGTNKDYILNAIPHISILMVDSLEAAVSHGETIVIGNNGEEFSSVLTNLAPEKTVVDLVRITDQKSEEGRYDGICW